MYHQTTVEEQVSDALRAEIRALEQEQQELNANYPPPMSMPDAAVRRSLHITSILVRKYTEIGECMWCSRGALPDKAYCQACIDEQKRIAEEILAELRAEKSE